VYRSILVPLDGSKRAEAIIPHVENLARRYGAEVVFLQVQESPLLLERDEVVDWRHYQEESEHRRKQAESYLAAWRGEFQEKGIQARSLVFQGAVVRAILQAAEVVKADLIAMASHGRSGISRMFYGSVAAGVLHALDRPILLVRSRDND